MRYGAASERWSGPNCRGARLCARSSGPMYGITKVAGAQPCAPTVRHPTASEVDGQSADVAPGRAVGLERVEQERGVLRVSDLEAEEQLELEREMERLGHAHVHAVAAVLRPAHLRLAHVTVGDRQGRARRLIGRGDVAGDVGLLGSGQVEMRRGGYTGARLQVDGHLAAHLLAIGDAQITPHIAGR